MSGARRLGRWSATALGLSMLSGLLAACGGGGASATSWGASAAAPCDGLDSAGCMLPFPDDYYTTPDPSTATGLHVRFPAGALPRSASGAPLDPTPYQRNDGFSPGSTIVTHVPGIDIARSAIATLSDIGASMAPSAPIVVLDTTIMRRVPYWAELDANDPSPTEQLLLVHPARSLTPGHHYDVALRNLETSSGAPIAPEPLFAAVLHATTSGDAHRQAHIAHLEDVVSTLHSAGVSERGLFLAWDFTVISSQNLDGPALTMRDSAFGALHGGVPSYQVTQVVDLPANAPHLARTVIGTVSVPDFLSAPGGPPGSVLHYGADGKPAPLGDATVQAPFECEIPKSAVSDPTDPSSAVKPALVGLYGHGLFSSASEVTNPAVAQFSDAHDFVACATSWTGLSHDDLAYDLSMTSDLSRFQSVADRLTQAILNAQFLGRLLDDRRGFAANAAFQSASHTALIDPGAGLDYFGVSEGGIIGGAVTAVSTDVRRAVLTVPGMDFDVLIDRSADFSAFAGLLDKSYPDRMVQQFLFDVLQMLWDRGETDGYAAHLASNPLPGTPAHQVLLAEAFGDHQVANVATETEARTIGAAVHVPALAAGRSNEAVSLWGLPALPDDGTSPGPALYVWDSGTPAPPLANVPPTGGTDPHGLVPLLVPAFWNQAAQFFTSGRIENPCDAGPCVAMAPAG
ncbi:MAG: hypothetical protein ACYDA2_00110 [Acidimicrobiales bacterium]